MPLMNTHAARVDRGYKAEEARVLSPQPRHDSVTYA
jgi:hypothetical protein